MAAIENSPLRQMFYEVKLFFNTKFIAFTGLTILSIAIASKIMRWIENHFLTRNLDSRNRVDTNPPAKLQANPKKEKPANPPPETSPRDEGAACTKHTQPESATTKTPKMMTKRQEEEERLQALLFQWINCNK